MTRILLLLIGSIPVLAAIFIAIPMITKPEIPITAATSNDVITIEYSKQHLRKITFGMTENIGAEKTELLTIQNDGTAVYSVTTNGIQEPDKKYSLQKDTMKRLKALIKETGFIQIPKKSFSLNDSAIEFDKFVIKVTLNDESTSIQWPEQNATEEFIPPLLTQVKLQLENIISEIIE